MGLQVSKAHGEILGIRIAQGSALVTILIGILGLASHVFNLPVLRGMQEPMLQMRPNTAIGLICLGLALKLLILPRHKGQVIISRGLSGLVILLGTVTMIQYIFGFDIGIDQWFWPQLPTPENPYPGRMVPATAINFILKGSALLLLDWELNNGSRPAQYISIITALIPLQVLVAYSYGTHAILNVGIHPYLTQMAPHTAVAWFVVSVGTLCARPLSGFMRPVFFDSTTARNLRGIICAAVILPPVFAWLIALGESWSFYHPGFGSSLLILALVIIFVTFVWRASNQIVMYEEMLRDQAAKLERSNTALERFAAAASHDLKSPLQAMILNAELLERSKNLSFDLPAKKNVQMIKDNAKNMSALIDNILEYAVSRDSRIEIEDVDLNQVMEIVFENLKKEILEAKPEMDFSHLPIIRGDRLRLTQLFQNLISNSIKYRQPGVPCKISVSALDRGDHWLFNVKDNGIGFDSSDADSIFEPFKRLSHVAKKPGAGIGLATCKEIVDQHQGRIWAESRLNEGSMFYFTISKVRKGAELGIFKV